MKLHPEELTLARAYSRTHPFESLTDRQMNSIMDRGRALHRWFKDHPHLHHAIGAAVLVFIFAVDFFALLKLPHLLLPAGTAHAIGRIVLAAAAVGSLHSYLMYSLTGFSMHEGASHQIIFLPKSRVGRVCNFIANNLAIFEEMFNLGAN